MHLRSACSIVVLASLLAIPVMVQAAAPDISSKIKSLGSTDDTQRAQAVEAISQLAGGPDAREVVTALVKALDKADSQTRYQIVRLLADFGKGAEAPLHRSSHS